MFNIYICLNCRNQADCILINSRSSLIFVSVKPGFSTISKTSDLSKQPGMGLVTLTTMIMGPGMTAQTVNGHWKLKPVKDTTRFSLRPVLPSIFFCFFDLTCSFRQTYLCGKVCLNPNDPFLWGNVHIRCYGWRMVASWHRLQ